MTTRRPGLSSALAAALAEMPDPVGANQVSQYESELARHFGVAFAVAVASGTAALHCALAACGIGPGDEVLVSAVSVVMSAAPVLYAGARPVFADCDPSGADFSYDDLTEKITSHTKAIIPVHLWGRAGDPARLADFAATRGLRVIEDACQAHGTRIGGHLAGTFGDLGCFSTKDGKLLWSGEGGFILTRDPDLAGRCRALRTHWQTPPAGEAPLARLGFNYRLAEPLAAIARVNLARFDQLLAHRQHQTNLLATLLTGVPWIDILTCAQGWNGYAPLARINLRHPRGFTEHLAALGVANSVGTYRLTPCDRRPMFADFSRAPCPAAATFIESLLAVIVTEHDDDDCIHRYADVISQEAARWADHY
jgi:perosamine synthetase